MRELLRPWAIVVGLAILCSLSTTRLAFAEAPGPRTTPVHVLGIDSDDAEDQADALTGSLRSRIRSAPGWSLQETQHALGMLTAALRCPQKPDAACLQRIGDQLHTDRFVWGVMSKAPGSEVTAEVHLWTRGHPDVFARETYSDNLQDQNDETLRRIATRILDKLAGITTKGTLTVHAGDAEGVVWINGQKNRALERGAATIELIPGRYDIEVRAPGFAAAAQEGVVVNPGQDTSVPFKMVAVAQPVAAAAAPESKVGVRRVLGWTLIGLGVVGEIVAGVEGFEFLSAKNDLDNARSQVPATITDVCSNAPNTQFNGVASDACSKYNEAATDRMVGIIAASAGGVVLLGGAVLLLTDRSKESGGASSAPAPSARAERPRFQLLPYASPRGTGGGVDVVLMF
jgi:hypothetical protein